MKFSSGDLLRLHVRATSDYRGFWDWWRKEWLRTLHEHTLLYRLAWEKWMRRR